VGQAVWISDDLAALPRPVRRELIVGGQKSGKSRRAEQLVQAWLAQSSSHRALVLATARADDAEMRQRIDRHRADRAQRLPGVPTLEEPLELAGAIARHSQPHTLLMVDCLTLWLTQWLMPAPTFEQIEPVAPVFVSQEALFFEAIQSAPGPLVLVSNEIGWGVTPLGPQVRAFVDAQGRLNQRVAQLCERVTLMAAGLPLLLKGGA
jgi:adenosylcobinamide kinase/adenosylcobinamide-phosphate guanylyltransferase